MDLQPDACYEAVASRDRRFDGRFFTAVVTTGVYCRPGCPARTPRRRNVRFYPSAPAAEAAGFRACRKCRPDAAPGTPWSATSETVARGLAAISEGALDEDGLEALGARLGVGARHLRRLFQEELGTSPRALALTRRVHFARTLLHETGLPITQVALASGFQSIRAFNEAFRRSFGESPSDSRAKKAGPKARSASDRIRVKLAYRPPLAWDAMLTFLAKRAIPGVELVEGGEYARVFEIGRARGVLRARALEGRDALELEVPPGAAPELLGIVERVRRLFDLAADPLKIADRLERDPLVGRRVRAVPGLRVPGAFDPFELGVRAILGQQVSVAGATTLAGRIVAFWGTPLEGAPKGLGFSFPSARVLAEAPVERAGMPRARAQAVRGFAAAVASGKLALERGRPLAETTAALESIAGIGSWTAQYIALRALGEPDAFPSSDLGIRKALAKRRGNRGRHALETSLAEMPSAREVEALAEPWRPWRAYAALYLWSVT